MKQRNPNTGRISPVLYILTIFLLPLIFSVTHRIGNAFLDAHPFYHMTAEEILRQEHYDLREFSTEVECGGRVYHSIAREEYPYPLTEAHYAEYVIMEIVDKDGAAGYALLRHKEDRGTDYLLLVPEEEWIPGGYKRPLGTCLRAVDVPAGS